MADAAQIVEGMGADIVDVNMGCPVPKISKHNAGCSLMRDPEHAARVVGAMTRAVKIPVTVKMRAGWNDGDRNAPLLARMVQDAGAAAVTIHGRTAEQSYKGLADWELVSRVAGALDIPVLGSGDCVEPEQIIERLATGVSGVLVGRGVLRNPWILAQAADVAVRSCGATREPARARPVPARLHPDAARRTRQRSRRVPPRGSRGRAPSRRMRAGRPVATSGGSSTSFVRSVRGIRRGSTADRSCASASTARSACSQLRQIVDEYFLTEEAPVPGSRLGPAVRAYPRRPAIMVAAAPTRSINRSSLNEMGT